MSELETFSSSIPQDILPEQEAASINIESKINAENWSESLLQKYGELQLPSLYDFILSQEKISLEIRKQNKDLRTLLKAHEAVNVDLVNVKDTLANVYSEVCGISDFCTTNEVNDEDIAEEENDNEVYSFIELEKLKKDTNLVLMHSMDTMLTLLNASEDFAKNLMAIVPATSGVAFWRKPAWRIHFEEVLHGYLSGLNAAREKLLSLLVDKEIQIINPLLGTSFDPESHRAVEKAVGGKFQCISKVIRYGYKVDGEIIRFADVSVFL